MIRYEGDEAGANEMLRTLAGMFAGGSFEVVTVGDDTPPSLEPEAFTSEVNETVETQTKTVYQSGKGVSPGELAGPADDRDGDRYAFRGSELQEAIYDYVKLNGPKLVRDLAVAMQRAGQAIGKAVSTSDKLYKGTDNLVHARD